MRKVLVTGGSGFIGGHIVQECQKRGMLVTIWDKSKPKYWNHAEFHQVDIAKPVSNLGFGTCKFDYIFHAAGELGSHTTFDRIRSTFDVNINSIINLLEWVKAYPALPENDYETEEACSHTNPHIINCGLIRDWLNPYMISKHTASKIGQMYKKEYGLNFLDCRMTVVFGPRQGWKEEKIVPSFILNALSGRDLTIYGDGSSLMNMMYIKDIAKLLVDIASTNDLFDKDAPNMVDIANPNYNISVKQFAEYILSMVKTKSKIVYNPMRIGQPGNVGVTYDLDPIYKYINLDSYFESLDASIVNTIHWYEGVI